MSMFHEKTALAARGRWKGILMHVGVSEGFLSGRNCPCPFCGGTDRFRFLDKDGSGSWICNKCCDMPGTGMDFVMQHTGLSFKDAAARVDEIIRNVKPSAEKPKPEMTDDERRNILRSTWNEARPMAEGDLVSRYLASRGLEADTTELRFSPALRDGEGGIRPAMVARVLNADGSRVATLHRTFLRPDGLAKAEMPTPRKLMPGEIPEGAAVRLGPIKEALGIAEGIETALAASEIFELPVWAAISSPMLVKWWPPEGVEEVFVFGDHDENYDGQAAAFGLAKRLMAKGIRTTVRLPTRPGDWNDELLCKRGAA